MYFLKSRQKAAFLLLFYLDKTSKMNLKTLTLSSLILIFTSSCSGTYHAYYQTLKIVFSEQEAAQLSFSEVQQSRIDVISVKRGERPSAIMALAYLENNQHKWVSSDNVMLVMEKGRVVRTLGLDNNLLYTSNSEMDPLKLLQFTLKDEPKSKTWSRVVDRSGDEYGYPIESTFNQASADSIQALNLNIETVLYIENLSYMAPSNYLRFNTNWKNYFWFAKNGALVKSIQQDSPLSESIEIIYLSRISRLNQ
jgi:hypothetical protein